MVKTAPPINRRPTPRSLGSANPSSGRIGEPSLSDLPMDDLYPTVDQLVEWQLQDEARNATPTLEDLVEAEDRKLRDQDRRKRNIDAQLDTEADFVDLFEPERSRKVESGKKKGNFAVPETPFWYSRNNDATAYNWLDEIDLPFTDRNLVGNFTAEPIDPEDCVRWPGSPLCRGTVDSLIDTSTGGWSFGVGLDFTQTPCETVLEITPEFGFVGLPPMVIGIRSPDCKPRVSPPLPPPLAFPDLNIPTFYDVGDTGYITVSLTVTRGMVLISHPANREVERWGVYSSTLGDYAALDIDDSEFRIEGYAHPSLPLDLVPISATPILETLENTVRLFGSRWGNTNEPLYAAYYAYSSDFILKNGIDAWYANMGTFPMPLEHLLDNGNFRPVMEQAAAKFLGFTQRRVRLAFRKNGGKRYPYSRPTRIAIAENGEISGYGNWFPDPVFGCDRIGLYGVLYESDGRWFRLAEYIENISFIVNCNGESIGNDDHSPPDQLTEPDMTCCEETNALVKSIYKRYAKTEDWGEGENSGVTVPSELFSASDDTVTLDSFPKLFFWFIRQFDALIGQWPVEVEVVRGTGEQSEKIKLPNVAETLTEIYALALSSAVDSDTSINFSSRLAAELLSVKAMVRSAVDYGQANAEFLGYKGNLKKREIPSSFSPQSLSDENSKPEDILENSVLYTTGWENSQEDTLTDALKKLLFAAAITKAVHFRANGNSTNTNSEDGVAVELLDFAKKVISKDSSLNDFIAELNDPQSKINKDFPTPKAEII